MTSYIKLEYMKEYYKKNKEKYKKYYEENKREILMKKKSLGYEKKRNTGNKAPIVKHDVEISFE
jgi:hypothetical protein